MYEVTSMRLDNRTLAILRKAELGFLGVIVLTCKHTPRLCGQEVRAGDLPFFIFWLRLLRINCCIVGIFHHVYLFIIFKTCPGGDQVSNNNVLFEPT